jgi:hypothetical protein
MRRRSVSRHRNASLLTRPPLSDRDPGWAAWTLDPARQLEELDSLCRRGLLTSEEFEEQKARLLRS